MFAPVEEATSGRPMDVVPPLLHRGANADILQLQRVLFTSIPHEATRRLSLTAPSPKLLARLLISLIADTHNPSQQLYMRADFEHDFNPKSLSPESFFVSPEEMVFTVYVTNSQYYGCNHANANLTTAAHTTSFLTLGLTHLLAAVCSVILWTSCWI